MILVTLVKNSKEDFIQGGGQALQWDVVVGERDVAQIQIQGKVGIL